MKTKIIYTITIGLAITLIVIFTLYLYISGNTNPENATDIMSSYRLAWSDEFKIFDERKWTEIHTDGLYRDENVFIRDDNLIISVNYADNNYRSGYIRTKDKFNFRYGFIEMKAKLADGNGYNGAINQFWISSAGEWNNEIDIFEQPTKNPNLVRNAIMHRDTNGKEVWKHSDKYFDFDLGGTYHLYQLEWTPDHVIWFIDNTEIFREMRKEFIPHTGMDIRLAVCVGQCAYPGWFSDSPIMNIVPTELMIDYIRIYQKI